MKIQFAIGTSLCAALSALSSCKSRSFNEDSNTASSSIAGESAVLNPTLSCGAGELVGGSGAGRFFVEVSNPGAIEAFEKSVVDFKPQTISMGHSSASESISGSPVFVNVGGKKTMRLMFAQGDKSSFQAQSALVEGQPLSSVIYNNGAAIIQIFTIKNVAGTFKSQSLGSYTVGNCKIIEDQAPPAKANFIEKN